MLLLSIFTTVEFYVITAFIAALVVGFAALPSRRGPARQILVAGSLRTDAAPSEPGIVAIVGDDGSLTIYRFGLEGVPENGAYSLAVNIAGFDVTIDERLTPGRRSADSNDIPVTAAMAEIPGFGAERYHFNYRSETLGRSAAFTLNIRPGNRIERLLS